MPEIDLSRLPPPTVVEPIDYETILAAMMADYVGRYPEFTAWVESEPALKLLEVAAYREMLLRVRINEAAKQNMLAFAEDANLDHLVAMNDVKRADGEGDPRLLRRFRLSLEALSVAGPLGAYEFHALSADPRVARVTITTPVPGTVRLVVIGGDHADGLPDAALVDTVRDALDDALVRPLTDTVEVLAARNICYQVTVTLHVESGPDRALVRAAAERAVRDYVLGRHQAGEVVYKAGITAAAQVPGVSHSIVAFAFDDGTPYDADRLDVAALGALPAEWVPVAAFWPALPGSVSGGAGTTDVGAGAKGYASPSTAPADGVTVQTA